MKGNLTEQSGQNSKMSHCLTLENRKNLVVSGVREVGGFDDKAVELLTDTARLSIRGENLNIKKLNLELGDLEVEGKISALTYTAKGGSGQGRFFPRLFK